MVCGRSYFYRSCSSATFLGYTDKRYDRAVIWCDEFNGIIICGWSKKKMIDPENVRFAFSLGAILTTVLVFVVYFMTKEGKK